MGCGSSMDTSQPVIGAQGGVVRSESMEVAELLMCDDGLSNPLEIHFSCQSLPNLDITSKTDPFVILYLKDDAKGRPWSEVGRTEQIRDCLDPVFVRQITIKYQFEVRQQLKVEVWDCDDPTTRNLNAQELVGTCELLVADLVRSKTKTLNLANPKIKKNGTVTLTAEQIKSKFSSNVVKFNVVGESFSRSKLMFFKLYRGNSTGAPVAPMPGAPPALSAGPSFVPVYQSEAKKGEGAGNVLWNPVKIGAAALMRDQPTWPLRLEILECVASGDHRIVENRALTYNDLVDSNFVTSGSYGKVRIKSVEMIRRVSFTEYLMAGTNIMMSLAVDFTASNRSCNNPDSLHCMDMSRNQYIQAIHSVGGILQMYDSDKNIPVYGFGGQIHSISPETYHFFALNGNIFSPEVYTIEQVQKLYMQNLTKIMFSGPTNFAPTINNMGEMARFYVSNGMLYNYIVLLIITDGEITDMDDTIDAIVRCSSLPLSIVIVGVGSGPFDNMEILDADRGKLKSPRSGQFAARDIVQFVPFSRYASDPTELAKATLAEIPGQLSEYMSMAKVPPLAGMQRAQMNEPSFYGSRGAEFQKLMCSRGFTEQSVAAVMNVGFPVEDPAAFARFVNQPYVNQMAI